MSSLRMPHFVRLVLLVLISLWLSLFMGLAFMVAGSNPASAGDAVCSDGRTSLAKIANDYAVIEQKGGAGRMWNRLFKAPGGGSILYVVLERQKAADIYVFQDDCLIIARTGVDGDQLLRLVGKTTRSDAFPDGGI